MHSALTQLLPDLNPLSSDALARLSQAPQINLTAQMTLLAPGDRCRDFLIVLDGSIRVFGRSAQGRELDMYHISPQQTCVLTTSCLLSGERYPAQAQVEQAGHALLINAELFHWLLDQESAFRQFVFQNYASRLSDLLLLVQSVAFERMDVRLTRYLLQSSRHSLVISLSHQQIADALGTAREVISRQLKQMEHNGWIALSRGQIFLLQPAILQALVDNQGAV